MSSPLVLTVFQDGQKIKEFPLTKEATLGRAESCSIQLKNQAVSRQHALLRPTPSGAEIERRSEFAFLNVNGAEVTSAQLASGDVISLGPYLIKISGKSAENASALHEVIQEEPLRASAALADAALADAVLEKAVEALSEGEIESERPGETTGGTSEDQNDLIDDSKEEGEALFLSEEPSAQEGSIGFEEISKNLALNKIEEPTASELLSEDDATQALGGRGLSAVLSVVTPEGNQNYPFEGHEVVIGRSKKCEITLDDKKLSRRNTSVRREGARFVIKDLGSSNGTYVNDVRVQEQDLVDDDNIMVGDTILRFSAKSKDYEKNKINFLSVPEESEEFSKEFDENQVTGFSQMDSVKEGLSLPGAHPAPSVGLETGIPGLDVGNQPVSLVDKFKAQPRPRQVLIILVLLSGILFLFPNEDKVKRGPASKSKIVTKKGSGSTLTNLKKFSDLTPKEQQFVESQHALAFTFYKNKEYDKALFEIRKIFQLIPDFQDSREIERYSVEGKRKLEALVEEKRRREEASRIKAKVALLLEDAEALIEKKRYEQAGQLFPEILALDPENKKVAQWQEQFKEFESKRQLQEQQRRVQEQINAQAKDVYHKARGLKKQGKYLSAIAEFSKIKDMGTSDKRLLKRTRYQIWASRQAVNSKRDPLLAEAKELESSGELAPAYKKYEAATVVDPGSQSGYEGMKRIRGVLHDRSKLLYTEAVLAESYSDFKVAKTKFKEILQTAPKDDVYYSRAKRKLGRYLSFVEEEVAF